MISTKNARSGLGQTVGGKRFPVTCALRNAEGGRGRAWADARAGQVNRLRASWHLLRPWPRGPGRELPAPAGASDGFAAGPRGTGSPRGQLLQTPHGSPSVRNTGGSRDPRTPMTRLLPVSRPTSCRLRGLRPLLSSCPVSPVWLHPFLWPQCGTPAGHHPTIPLLPETRTPPDWNTAGAGQPQMLFRTRFPRYQHI